jgi:hypothetical protein
VKFRSKRGKTEPLFKELEFANDPLERLAERSTLPATASDAFAVAAESTDLLKRAAAFRKMNIEGK